MKRRERRRIDNKEFLSLLLNFSNKLEKHPGAQIPNDLGKIIDDLIYNIETSGSFNRYTYRDEMRSEARKNCFSAISQQKFDLARINPFAYFTTIVMNSFYKVISDERKVSAIKNSLYEEFQLTHPNNRFEEINDIKSEIYKQTTQEHSDWTPLTIKTSNGRVRVFETEESWEKHLKKKREKMEVSE